MRRAAMVLTIGLMVAAPVWAQRKVDEVRPLAADGRVEIENLAGSVQVVGWGENQVEITGVLGKNVRDLEIDGDETHVEISVDVPRHADDLETELVVKVPSNASVEVSTVSASIQVGGVAGPVGLESVSGNIVVAGTPSELSVEAVSGSITLENAAFTSTDLESVSGTILVKGGSGELWAETVSGTVTVAGGQFETAGFESVSGSIIYAGQMSVRGEYDFETVSGTVTLKVPASVSAEFYVETFSGSIENAIGPEARRTSQYTPEKELSFTAGSGGAEVSVSTFSGAVHIRTEP